MKKIHFPSSKKLWIPILVLVLVCQSFLLLTIWDKINVLWQQSNPSPNVSMGPEVRDAIQGTIHSRYKAGVVDAEAERVYFPALGIYVPLNLVSEDLYYSYKVEEINPNEFGLSSGIYFSTGSVLKSFAKTFADVPCLQSMVELEMNSAYPKNSPGKELAYTLPLIKNGKDSVIHYFYKNTNSVCTDFWGTVNPDDIINVLKEAKSY